MIQPYTITQALSSFLPVQVSQSTQSEERKKGKQKAGSVGPK
jgi:hypothetical protein